MKNKLKNKNGNELNKRGIKNKRLPNYKLKNEKPNARSKHIS
jgi:hypothetical protein